MIGSPHRQQASALIRQGEREGMDERYRLSEEQWARLVDALSSDTSLPLLGLWCTGPDIHALFLENNEIPIISTTELQNSRYLALSSARPSAAIYERTARDLWGADAMEATDTRPWLDQGFWPLVWPLSARAIPNTPAQSVPDYRSFQNVETSGGEILQTGPIHDNAGGPYITRIAALRGKVRGAEFCGGFAHSGVSSRMVGLNPEDAAKYAGRIGMGQSAAHQAAFARAFEMAAGQHTSDSTIDWRVIICELERICTHLWDLARIASALQANIFAARAEILRETLLSRCRDSFGNRQLMDVIVPNRPPQRDFDLPDFINDIDAITGPEVDNLLGIYESSAELRSPTRNSGVIENTDALRWGVGGLSARASGRSYDARRIIPGYRPKGFMNLERRAGDIDARIRLRLHEISGSLRHMQAVISAPNHLRPQSGGTGEGIGVAEGPRGDIWYWVKLSGNSIRSVFIRDPASAALGLIEEKIVGNKIENIELFFTSFGLSASAVEL